MQRRQLLTVVLVIGLLVPVAGATMASEPAPSDERRTATASDAAGDSGGAADETADATDYSRLYVDDRYQRLRLKPGETDTVAVTVVNADEDPVTIDPHLVAANPGSRAIDDDWVAIDADATTLDPDQEVDVTLTVSVPEDAAIGDYRAQLALTDERVTHPGQPARPVHAAQLNVEVWREPTVAVRAGRHLTTQVEAGGTYTHEIVVENTGDEAVPVDPEVLTDRAARCRGHCPGTVERSWFSIDAPAEIEPGETATIAVTIAPPERADRARYRTEIDLGLEDPARDERDDRWQRVRLNFQVWKQPDAPYETSVVVSDRTTDLTLTLSPRQPRHYHSGAETDADPARFDVELVSPDGEVVEPERVQVRENGFVDMSGERPDVVADQEYAVRSNGEQFVYRIDDPAAGTWTVRIMPHNTVGFGYEVVRNEAEP